MKKIDWYILKQFLRVFFVTFFLVLFVLIMQIMWGHIKNFAGKGLGIGVMLEFIFYTSQSLIPIATPLAILLASIMTYGNMGEKYELSAIKASGVSLFRAFRPLLCFVLLICVGMYFFSEEVLPRSNFKLLNLKTNMVRKNIGIQLQPGYFDKAIPGYFIRIGDKSGEQREVLEDVYIHQSSEGNNKKQLTIIAEKGEILGSPNPNYLIMKLKNGVAYEQNWSSISPTDRKKQPLQKNDFKELTQYINISKINKMDTTVYSKTDRRMLNTKQLIASIDTIKNRTDRSLKKKSHSLYKKVVKKMIVGTQESDFGKENNQFSPFGKNYKKKEKIILVKALENIKLDIKNGRSYKKQFLNKVKDLGRNQLELHRKFSVAFSCMVLFLVGAPLGSIVRKGGFGMPFVISIVIFVIYFIISMVGENLLLQGKLHPFVGTWLNSIILLPFAIYLCVKANNDSVIFQIDSYTKPIKNLFSKFKNKK